MFLLDNNDCEDAHDEDKTLMPEVAGMKVDPRAVLTCTRNRVNPCNPLMNVNGSIDCSTCSPERSAVSSYAKMSCLNLPFIDKRKQQCGSTSWALATWFSILTGTRITLMRTQLIWAAVFRKYSFARTRMMTTQEQTVSRRQTTEQYFFRSAKVVYC